MTARTWDIGRPAEQCIATGATINPGDEFIAALVEQKDESLHRLDYTLDAWADAPRPDGLYAFWKAVRPHPNEKKQLLIDASTITEIFDQLADATEPGRVAFRFVLALILTRKRILAHLGQKDAHGDEPARMLVRFRGSDKELPPIEVIDPDLDAETIMQLSEQIRAVMALDED